MADLSWANPMNLVNSRAAEAKAEKPPVLLRFGENEGVTFSTKVGEGNWLGKLLTKEGVHLKRGDVSNAITVEFVGELVRVCDTEQHLDKHGKPTTTKQHLFLDSRTMNQKVGTTVVAFGYNGQHYQKFIFNSNGTISAKYAPWLVVGFDNEGGCSLVNYNSTLMGLSDGAEALILPELSDHATITGLPAVAAHLKPIALSLIKDYTQGITVKDCELMSIGTGRVNLSLEVDGENDNLEFFFAGGYIRAVFDTTLALTVQAISNVGLAETLGTVPTKANFREGAVVDLQYCYDCCCDARYSLYPTQEFFTNMDGTISPTVNENLVLGLNDQNGLCLVSRSSKKHLIFNLKEVPKSFNNAGRGQASEQRRPTGKVAFDTKGLPYVNMLIVGAPKTGKTSIANQFVSKKFSEDIKEATSLSTWELASDHQTIKLRITELSSNEGHELAALLSMHLLTAHVALVVYDVTVQESYIRAKKMVAEILQVASPQLIVMLVGNKMDRDEDQVVGSHRAADYAKDQNILFREVSCCLGKLALTILHDIGELMPDEIRDLLDEIVHKPEERTMLRPKTGWICPQCREDYPTPLDLIAHFNDYHARSSSVEPLRSKSSSESTTTLGSLGLGGLGGLGFMTQVTGSTTRTQTLGARLDLKDVFLVELRKVKDKLSEEYSIPDHILVLNRVVKQFVITDCREKYEPHVAEWKPNLKAETCATCHAKINVRKGMIGKFSSIKGGDFCQLCANAICNDPCSLGLSLELCHEVTMLWEIHHSLKLIDGFAHALEPVRKFREPLVFKEAKARCCTECMASVKTHLIQEREANSFLYSRWRDYKGLPPVSELQKKIIQAQEKQLEIKQEYMGILARLVRGEALSKYEHAKELYASFKQHVNEVAKMQNQIEKLAPREGTGDLKLQQLIVTASTSFQATHTLTSPPSAADIAKLQKQRQMQFLDADSRQVVEGAEMFEVWQNERYFPVVGYIPTPANATTASADPGPWSTARFEALKYTAGGQKEKTRHERHKAMRKRCFNTKEEIRPFAGLVWDGEWELDQDDQGDEDGWWYNTSFEPGGWSVSYKLRCCRRRKWCRAVKIQDYDSTATDDQYAADVEKCTRCLKPFGKFSKKVLCVFCKWIVCDKCSSKQRYSPDLGYMAPCCTSCHEDHADKPKKIAHAASINIVIKEIWENQRLVPIAGWKPSLHMVRAPFSDVAGGEAVGVLEAVQPAPGFKFLSTDWHVDKEADVDKDGWMYKFSFPMGEWTNSKHWNSNVRRRRLIRKMSPE